MTGYKKIEEPIEVLVSFKGDKPRPLFFRWNGKKYKVKEINLVHKKREGKAYRWYFSCFDGTNYFKLCFLPRSLSWSLEELYFEVL